MNMLVTTPAAAVPTTLPMSEARTNPQINALNRLRGLVAKLERVTTDLNAAMDHHSEVEVRLFKALPKRPDFTRDMPVDVQAAFDAMTVAQLRDAPADNVYVAWQRQNIGKQNVKTVAYDTERKRLSTEYGFDTACDAVSAGHFNVSSVLRAIMRTKISGLEGIALKLRALRVANHVDDVEAYPGLLSTIDATAEMYGYDTGRS
jgi:hypothetical protein